MADPLLIPVRNEDAIEEQAAELGVALLYTEDAAEVGAVIREIPEEFGRTGFFVLFGSRNCRGEGGAFGGSGDMGWRGQTGGFNALHQNVNPRVDDVILRKKLKV